jgi:hypothetical protein
MSEKTIQLETIDLKALAAIAGGRNGAPKSPPTWGRPAQETPWDKAYRSGKLNGQGSTVDFLNRNHGRSSWRQR